jgi:hypothetical protein
MLSGQLAYMHMHPMALSGYSGDGIGGQGGPVGADTARLSSSWQAQCCHSSKATWWGRVCQLRILPVPCLGQREPAGGGLKRMVVATCGWATSSR